MPYLHLPFQAGADRVLAAMNRKHTAADYLAPGRPHPRRPPRHRAVHRYHRRLSRRDRGRFRGHARAWSSDVGFAQAYSFKYSPRPGTPGATMARSGPRWRQGRAAASPARAARPPANGVQFQRASARLSRCCSSARAAIAGQLVGRSPYLQAVHAAADSSCFGRVVQVAIAGAGPNSLSGGSAGG